MNKHQFRLIFNAARGMRMAVSELASSCGKTASGNTQAPGSTDRTCHTGGFASNQPLTHTPIAQAAIKTIAVALGMLTLGQWAAAQIVADRNAPNNQQPTILNSANGVPQVNIQTPSAAGVSRNTYSQFDVDARGAVLNNSRTNTATQLGGFVQGNPWLATGSARVILNEVNASSASQLRGFVEVAGQRAEVIVANPAGIAINGGGFLNASAVTLTTGTAQMQAGSLESFQVRGGTVTVQGAGLDTSTADYTNILSRAVQVNAGIWAKDLKVTTGLNDVRASNAAAPTASAVTGTAPGSGASGAPSFALDVAAIGGMYAGKITLVGTESGLGVNNAGSLAAQSGNLVLNANGMLTNSGSVYASGHTSITTQGNISNVGTGLLAAGGNTSLSAQGAGSQVHSASGAMIAAGMDSTGAINNSTANISILSADATSVRGQLATMGDTSIGATSIRLDDATVNSKNLQLTATMADISAARATLAVSETLTASTQTRLVTDAATVTAKQLSLSAHDISNVAGTLQQSGTGDTTITLAGSLDNSNGKIAGNSNQINLSVQRLNNNGGSIAGNNHLGITVGTDTTNTGSILANKDLSFSTTAKLTNSGKVQAGKSLTISANTLDNQAAGELSSTVTTLSATSSFTNRGLVDGGDTAGTGSTRIQSATVNNLGSGRIYGDALDITAHDIANLGGTLQQRGSAETNLTVTGTLDNTLGRLSTQGNLNLNVQSLNNQGGTLASNSNLSLTLGSDTTNAGSILAHQNVAIGSTSTVVNNGKIQGGGNLTLDAGNLENTVHGEISSGAVNLHAQNTITNRGLIDAGNATGTAQTRLTAQTIDNLGTGAIFGDNVAIGANTLNNLAERTGGVVSGATIAARSSLNLGVQTLNNSDMGLDTPANPSQNPTATPSVNILSLGDIRIGGSIDAAGQAQGTAASINNSSATIEAGRHIRINALAINNTDAHFAWTNQSSTTAVSETIGSTASDYYVDVTQRTVSGPVVTAALPGKIAAAGDFTIEQALSINNSNSQMLAGGAFTPPAGVNITNAGAQASRTTTISGTAHSRTYETSCKTLFQNPFGGGDTCVVWGDPYPVSRTSPYTSTQTATVIVGEGVHLDHVNVAAPGVDPAKMETISLANPSAASVQTPIRLTTPDAPGIQVPSSSLFHINPSPLAKYVVETNPAFTHYQTWLDSDYMLQRLVLDPSVTQKRLGDGFYEQRLLNEQVAQLTGRRFLGDYTSDQQQYRALMDAGILYAKALQLRPGVALTAEQIARLTSDIVWLQQTTVTLPDGSKTLALVPKVYLMPRSGDLAPTGALMSGASVNIQASSFSNSGTILGRTLVQINAETLNNLGGAIRGNTVALTATQDINNTGGSISAQDQLTLQAGRDINNTSTLSTTSTGNSRNGITNTTVDRVAGFYVTADNGVLLANAGRDINLIASQIKNSAANGHTVLSAGNNIQLGTLTTSQTNNLEFDAGNYRRATSTAEVGSSIEGAGNISLHAGNDITARAAQVTSGKTLDVSAVNNIIVQAGQSTTSVDQMASATSTDLFTTKSIQTQHQETSATAQVSSFTGRSTHIVAQNNLASVGTKFEATGLSDGSGTLHVQGKNQTLLYEAQNIRTSTTATQSTTTLGIAFGVLANNIKLEDKTSTDSAASSTSIGTKLISTQKIEIGVGNKADLRGAVIEAPQTSFIQTDPSKAGELILGASTDTRQTAHTEKTETTGLYQEMKGAGQTTQTLNQTKISGQVSFDAALKITAQIPDTKGGQDLKTQIQALTGANTASSAAGLDYLNQLATNPQVQWDTIALAHEQWSYDQAGLTPAGAALLSIAVAAATGGVGAGLTGSTGAMGAAMSAGFSSLASQAAVTLVNNRGDIGKTLADLGKEESIKNLAQSMLTAGALDKLNTSMQWQNTNASSSFGQQLTKNLTNSVASSAMDAAINGRAFDEKALAGALKGALINTGMAQGANAIGDGLVAKNLNEFTHKLAHAVLGCAGGAAMSDKAGGCAAGAVGAVVGEISAEYATQSGMDTTRALALAQVLAAASGVIVGGGGDNAAAVNTATTTGANAAQNNYLKHAQILAKEKALTDCGTGSNANQCRSDVQQSYNQLSRDNTKRLANCADTNSCRAALAEISADYVAMSTRRDQLEALDYKGQATVQQRQELLDLNLNIDSAFGGSSTLSATAEQAWRQLRASTAYSDFTDAEKSKTFADAMMTLGGLGGAMAVGSVKVSPVEVKGGAGASGGTNVAGEVVTPVTSGGTANVVTVPGLKGQLAAENLANIAAQDARLAKAVSGDGGKLNFSIGSGTATEANRLGQTWVGDGAQLVADQVGCPGCWKSADGLRIYRPPTPKNAPSSFNPTGVQANFVTLSVNPATGSSTIVGNGHLVVLP